MRVIQEVFAVLMEPPRYGSGSVEEVGDGVATEYDFAFQAANARTAQAFRWLCKDRSTKIIHESVNGVLRSRGPRGKQSGIAERPDYVAPPLHLVMPAHAYIWGRSGDDFIMDAEVATIGHHASVTLLDIASRKPVGHLEVDMYDHVIRTYSRLGIVTRLRDFTGSPPDFGVFSSR